MTKVFSVRINACGKNLYGNTAQEMPMQLYCNYESAVSAGLKNAMAILKNDFGFKTTPKDFRWTTTPCGGEWFFMCKTVTGFASVICTICEMEVF